MRKSTTVDDADEAAELLKLDYEVLLDKRAIALRPVLEHLVARGIKDHKEINAILWRWSQRGTIPALNEFMRKLKVKHGAKADEKKFSERMSPFISMVLGQ